jgi:hypothetical protein
MCRLSSSQYDLYRRTNSGLGRSLVGWLRDLWRQRQPLVKEAEVVMFPAETAARSDQEADRKRSKAA